MKKFLNEFKTFISRGNVMDMAIGVVIATAFGKISASLVADIIMPLIGCLIGGVDLATLNITLKPAVIDGETVVSEAVVLGLVAVLRVDILSKERYLSIKRKPVVRFDPVAPIVH